MGKIVIGNAASISDSEAVSIVLQYMETGKEPERVKFSQIGDLYMLEDYTRIENNENEGERIP